MSDNHHIERLPTYKDTENHRKDDTTRTFDNIENASKFWTELWAATGEGNENAEWLQEICSAISNRVPPQEENILGLDSEVIKEAIRRKKNWSAPGPDRIANFWWKKVDAIHKDIIEAFQITTRSTDDFPLWLSEGKTTLIPKPGEFTSDNQRPITCLNTLYKWFTPVFWFTCLNTLYKWFTSSLLVPIDNHLDKFNLMEREQRGAKKGCSGTMDNLLIDRMVTQDCHRRNRNLCMAWIDVRKAYDSVSHKWLLKMMTIHRFSLWICRTISNLTRTWNTRIIVRTSRGHEQSDIIRFKKCLPQGDALCPRLFTLCLNTVEWKLKATEGYKLSKPIALKITNLLYIDDLKIYAASESKLNTVLKITKNAMKDIGLEWNSKKSSVANIRRGKSVQGSDAKVDEEKVVKHLEEGTTYKLLGVLKSVKQEDKLTPQCAVKIYLRRMSVIWSSRLSDEIEYKRPTSLRY